MKTDSEPSYPRPAYAEIIVALSNKEVDRVFHYKVPEHLRERIALGMRAFVPFGKGNKKTEGYVTGFTDTTDLQQDKLKAVIALPDGFSLFDEEMLSLAKWMRTKYYTTLFSCLKTLMPAGIKLKKGLGLKIKYAYLNEENPELALAFGRLSATAQGRVLQLLLENDGLPVSDIRQYLQISDSPIKTLEKNNLIIIESIDVKRDPLLSYEMEEKPLPILTVEQQTAVDLILQKIALREAEKHPARAEQVQKPVLIHGVTGSGKTEIYLRCIQDILTRGQHAIVLVPEISLTPQTVGVFISRFGDKVAVTHSRLSLGERYDQWKKALDGDISIMIGPRSAVFTPFKRLGIVIIDEEHESAYRSETTPKYSAFEVAEWRCQRTGAQLVLGSATPRIETYFHAERSEIDLVTLCSQVNNRRPQVTVVDMRQELALGNRSIFSNALVEAMKETLSRKNQIILFLNRRGHSTFISCRKCGSVMTCGDCNVNYTYHRYSDKLICHYCGKEEKKPVNCPVCGSVYIRYFGIGTQKIEDEARKLFPEENMLRMDLDTTGRKHSHEKILNQFKNEEASILIGTQMIAKGLDFPKVSLVGVIAADLSLNNGDFRSGETAFQLLNQVSGRAGRDKTEGRVFIQTYNPEHYSIRFAKENNYAEFYNHELSLRRQMNYPPYTHIFTILFVGEEEKKIIILLFKLLDIMESYNRKEQFETLGPAPAYISKIKNQYRWKLIVKGQDPTRLTNFVLYCMDKLKEQEKIDGVLANLTLDPLINV